MTSSEEPPADLRALLAFGTVLREGVELVREQGLGTTVVVGYDEQDADFVEGGFRVDLPLTAEEIGRAARNDNATVVTADLKSILMERVVLRPRSQIAATAGGTRHLFASRYAKETGKPVIVVSEERRSVTLYAGEREHTLRSRTELRQQVDDLMLALRQVGKLTAEADASDPAKHARLELAKDALSELRGHLAELGTAGRGPAIECALIATTLGLAWSRPHQTLPAVVEAKAALVPVPDPSAPSVRNEVSGTAGTVVQAGSIGTLHIHDHQPTVPPPQQLPPTHARFTGREKELAELDAILSGDDETPKIALITGAAGIGKTALVARCARLVADRFPDGVLYTDLRGFDPAGPPADPAEVLGGLLRDLGVPESSIPKGLDGAVRRYRSCLHGRRYLVVLDNARNADQVRPLVPGSSTCGVLATSRSEMRSLVAQVGARRLVLDVLPSGDAITLLDHAADAAGPLAAELARLCGYHPLALCIAAARLEGAAPDECADFLADLEAELLGTLTEANDTTASVAAAFKLSYDALPAAAQRTFRLLGTYPGPTLSRAAADVLAGNRAGIRTLLDAHLLESAGPGRYRSHDLVRTYAAECARRDEPAEERYAALRRVAGWFRETAEAHDRVLDAWRPRFPGFAPVPAEPGDGAAAEMWFQTELVNLAAVTRAAWEQDERDLTWRLALAPSAYFFSRKPWATWIEVQETGLKAARATGEREAVAWLCDGLGVAYRERRRIEDALQALREALTAFQESGDAAGEAQANLHLAQVHREAGELDAALQCATTALSLFESTGLQHGQARAANLLGGIHLALDNLPAALDHARQSVAKFDDLGDEHGRAWAVNNLASVLAKLGEREEAVAAFRAAEAARRAIDRYGLAFTLLGLGDVLAAQDPSDGEARLKYLEAFEIFDALDDPNAALVRARLKADELEAAAGRSVAHSLRLLSDRLATELDVAAGQGIDGDRHRLSTGLHVRRTEHSRVVALLRDDGYDKPVLVQGAAGEGKSSLLWALYTEYTAGAGTDAYLFDSSWLTSAAGHQPRVTIDALVAAAELARSRGHVPVYLVDTVDLLLHDERQRQDFLDLCDAIATAGAELVVTSRPEEARTLPAAAFRTVVLGPYDDEELPAAVAAHVAIFCPDAPPGSPEEKVGTIVRASARGLTIREVVLNPLKLRLLFELYTPDFPVLEHDVSTLYETYWERRVHTDRRGELAVADGADLSSTAENAGIALLASGLVELGERLLVHSATEVAVGRHPRGEADRSVVRAEVTTLAHRGVLARSGDAVRFFHQTMFEYAASRGLLARDGVRALNFLTGHLREHADDLFVGAVAEQALILAVDDPLCADAAAEILAGLAEAGVPLLQRIALGVLAHRPALANTTERLIEIANTAALRRYAQTIPTVARADAGLQIAMLERVWQRDKSVRKSVLEALERLSARSPAFVVAALRRLDCVVVVLSWKNDPGGMVLLLARVLVAAAPANPAWAGEELLALFDATIDRKTHRAVPCRVVELVAENWPVLGSPATAAAIRGRIVHSQENHDAAASEMRRALGRIEALEWRTRLDELVPSPDDWWLTTLEDVCARLERDSRDVLADARLQALAELITTGALGRELVTRTMTRLRGLSGAAPFALGWLFLPLLRAAARGDAPAVAAAPMVTELLDGLPAPGNSLADGPQRLAHAARQALRDAKLEPRQLAMLVDGVRPAGHVADWLDDAGLSGLLIPAAVGGHPIAQAALDRVKADVGELSPIGQQNVSYDLVPHLGRFPGLLRLLVELSVHRQAAQPLAEVVNDLDVELLAELRGYSATLGELVELLFAGSGTQQKEAASLWRRLYRAGAVDTPDQPTLAERFRATTVQAARGNVLELAVDVALDGKAGFGAVDGMLRRLFEVDPASGAVAGRGGRQAGHVARIARSAWLRLICRGGSTAELDLNEVFAVAVAAPADVDSFAVLGNLITRFARQGEPESAVEVLLRVAAAADAQLSEKQENALANKLRSALRILFRWSPLDVQQEVLRQVPQLPRTLARILVSAAAQENFVQLRPRLADLVHEELPSGVEQQIHDDIRVRSREAGRGTLPRLLLPLADDGSGQSPKT
ncbi:tetratricopeptide repeat protein [Amycolatopsis sp. NPDC049252]|uniref:tetratricopeptide repeat protein n=1 Tax=Amycolatopsis sp. NPDC049252 TaxID=3363933 RepID=UPI00371263AA